MRETEIEKKVTRLGPDDALRLARESRQVWVAKGKKVLRFDMGESPADDDLLAHLIGRSGFLRAPALRVGDKFVVGFSDELYRELFG